MDQAELDHLEQRTEALIERCQNLSSENAVLKTRVSQLLEEKKSFGEQKQQYQNKLHDLLTKLTQLEEQL